jgi:hypothetical protein
LVLLGRRATAERPPVTTAVEHRFAGLQPTHDNSVALPREAAPNATISCKCANRVGGCLASKCGATAATCNQVCICNVGGGGGYSCPPGPEDGCTEDELNRVCAVRSTNHVTPRGMHCQCVLDEAIAEKTAARQSWFNLLTWPDPAR